MSKVDWEAMTPREVFDALKSAPRVAGTWQPSIWGDGCVSRYSVWGDVVAVDGCDPIFGIAIRGDDKFVANSRADADDRLRELGWLLVDDNEGGAK